MGHLSAVATAYTGRRTVCFYWLFFHTNRPPTNSTSITMMNMMRVSITTPFVRTRHATNSVENSIPPKEGDRWTSFPELSCMRHQQGLTSNNNSAHRTFGNQCRAYLYSAHNPVSSILYAILCLSVGKRCFKRPWTTSRCKHMKIQAAFIADFTMDTHSPLRE